MLDKSYIDFDILWSWRIQNKLSQGEKQPYLETFICGWPKKTPLALYSNWPTFGSPMLAKLSKCNFILNTNLC